MSIILDQVIALKQIYIPINLANLAAYGQKIAWKEKILHKNIKNTLQVLPESYINPVLLAADFILNYNNASYFLRVIF